MRILTVLITLALGGTAYAVGDAGCGLGSMVFKADKKGHQILAATTNGIAGSQTFGITSGTSNCSSQGFVMNEKKIQHFAEANKMDLTREMAQGQGEKLSALATLYGCEGKATQTFASMVQSNYNQIVTSSDISATEMVNNLDQTILGNTQFVKACPL